MTKSHYLSFVTSTSSVSQCLHLVSLFPPLRLPRLRHENSDLRLEVSAVEVEETKRENSCFPKFHQDQWTLVLLLLGRVAAAAPK